MMRLTKQGLIVVFVALTALMPVPLSAQGGGLAPGTYQCRGAGGRALFGLNFTVSGGTYTTANGQRGTIGFDGGSISFEGAPPQNGYRATYDPGPPPTVNFLNVRGGTVGIICQANG
jgi:hypothetical protein